MGQYIENLKQHRLNEANEFYQRLAKWLGILGLTLVALCFIREAGSAKLGSATKPRRRLMGFRWTYAWATEPLKKLWKGTKQKWEEHTTSYYYRKTKLIARAEERNTVIAFWAKVKDMQGDSDWSDTEHLFMFRLEKAEEDIERLWFEEYEDKGTCQPWSRLERIDTTQFTNSVSNRQYKLKG